MSAAPPPTGPGAPSPLGEDEALLRAVADAMPEPVFVKDRDGRWLFANAATLGLFGKTLADVVGRTDAEIHPDPEVAAALMAVDRRVMESGVAETVEEVVETTGGRRVYLASKAPCRGRDGRVIGLVGNARDITERKRADEALRRSEERYRRFFEHIREGVAINQLVRDERGEIVDWTVLDMNPEGLRLVGKPLAEVVGRRATELYGADAAGYIRLSRVVMASAERQHAFDTYMTSSRRHFRAGAFALDDETYVTTGIDDTERWRAEEQVRQAQKLDSIGQLAGGVAHDFNNLLTVVLSGAEELRRGLAEGAPADPEVVDEIATAGARARDLTRQLLAFARRQVIEPVPLDVNLLLRDSEKLLRRVLGEHITLAAELEPGVWPVRCDPGQLEQVILNLALNARDAMPDGGRLVLETANVELDADQAAAHEGLRPGAHVRVAIRDSGHGMGPEVKDRLFEPFFTTKPRGRGTGLGLAMVYGIVKQSEGAIRVESEPDRGTTIELYFPRSAAAPAASETPGAGPARQAAGETVLVVEDDPRVRAVTARALAAAGYRVRVASDGTEALRVAAATPDLQLLVTDVVMPGMTGRQVADELHRRLPALRVLFVSGYARDAIAERGVLESGLEFLPKPFTPSTLLARVRAVLDALPGSRGLQPAS